MYSQSVSMDILRNLVFILWGDEYGGHIEFSGPRLRPPFCIVVYLDAMDRSGEWVYEEVSFRHDEIGADVVNSSISDAIGRLEKYDLVPINEWWKYRGDGIKEGCHVP